MDNNFYHQPVMVNEIGQYLITKDTGYYVDCTFGGGGHIRAAGFDASGSYEDNLKRILDMIEKQGI